MVCPRLIRLLVGALVAALVTLPVSSAGTVGAQGRTLLHFGDSLAVGTGIYLPGYLRGWHVSQSYDVSRHTDSGPKGLRAYGSSLPRVIVVSLGANDSPTAVSWFQRQVRDVVSAAGPTRCVIWSTIVRPPYNGVSYDGLNTALRRLAARYRTLLVFDWAAMARTHPEWFGRDGVHPTARGYDERARAIARLARGAC